MTKKIELDIPMGSGSLLIGADGTLYYNGTDADGYLYDDVCVISEVQRAQIIKVLSEDAQLYLPI